MRLHYRYFPSDAPAQKPLIILHGLFGSHNNWAAIARSLAGRRDVYALDLRNHGESPHHDEMSLRSMSDDVVAFLNGAAITRCTLLGHSLGGKVAMQLSFDHPAAIERLIVVDIAPRTYPPRHQAIFAAVDAIDTAQIASRNDADALIQAILPDQATRLFLLTNLKRNEQGLLVWRNNMRAIKNNYDAISAAPLNDIHSVFDGPTLFIRGTRSPYIEPADDELIQCRFPHVQHAALDTGHWVHADAPQLFIETVEDFLRQQSSAI